MNTRNKLSWIAALALGAAMAAPQVASAEKVRATRTARMMERPGEQSRVLKRVPAGREMKVVDHRGRWIRVQVGSETGWVTRTSVRSSDSSRADREPERRDRRRPFVNGRSTRRGDTSGPPEDRFGGDVVEGDDDDWDDDDVVEIGRSSRKRSRDDRGDDDRGDDDRGDDDRGDDDRGDDDRGDDDRGNDDRGDDEWDDEKADEEAPAADLVRVAVREAEVHRKRSRRSASAFSADRGDQLYVTDRRGNWVEVENDGGDRGWIHADDVEKPVSASVSPYEYPALSYKVDGGLGFANYSMAIASVDGVGPLGNNTMAAPAAAVNVGARALYAGSHPTRLLIADVSYRGANATPGIHYVNEAGTAGDISFSTHELDVGASYGYRFKRQEGLVASGRLGFHYGHFAVADLQAVDTANLARIPSESLAGFVVGARVEAPRAYGKFGALAGFDYVLGGSLAQTKGLEDGLQSSVSAWWASAVVDYQWKYDLKIVGAYRYLSQSVQFAGVGGRGHNATAAVRDDSIHSLTLGVGKTF